MTLIFSLLASAALALGVLLAVHSLWHWLTGGPRPVTPSSYERDRRTRMRQGSWVYRTFEPTVRRLAARNVTADPVRLQKLNRDLRVARLPLPWLPEEHLARCQVETGIVSLLVAGLIALLTGGSVIAILLVAPLAGTVYYWVAVNQATSQANRRVRAFKDRLPYAIDLLALLMEAGGTFLESLSALVKEHRGHPIGEEFGLVLGELEQGKPRVEAFREMQARLADPDVSELLVAIITGETLGTPLALVLRTQAEQLRLKRSQWAEKESAEAQVSIVFPGMVIMMACLLIIVAPFVLSAVYSL